MDNFANLDDGVYVVDNDGIITVHNLHNVSMNAQKEKMPKDVYTYYQDIKSALLSDGKIQSGTYLGKECFYAQEVVIAKFNIVDGTLHLYLKLSPQDRDATRFFNRPKHAIDQDKIFTLVVINNQNNYRKAMELVSMLKQKYKL